MAFSYGFFDSKNLDRVYTAENFTDYLSSLICNGIYDKFGQCFRLTASGGLTLTIGTGKAWIDGHYFLSDTPHTLDLSQYVDESLTKFVAIGISCDVSESVRACKLEVKQGTAATSPTIPTFQNTETKTYLTLCAVRLNGGTTEIVKNNITDYRGNETRCPYVRCILGKCKVSEILDSLAYYRQTVTDLTEQVTELQNRLTEIEAVTGATGVVLVSAGQCGDGVFYALFSNGSLKLYGNGSTYDYSYTDYNAVSPFFDNPGITSLSVGDGITSIGVGMFNRCINMKTVVFPDTLRSIGERAFWQEKNGGLTTLTIPNTCTQIGEKPVWRYATVRTYLRLSLADVIAGAIYVLIGIVAPDLSIGFGCGLIIFMGILLLTLFSRFMYQVRYAYVARNADKAQNKIKIAIVGAGNVGAILAEELIRNPKAHYIPVCFIDNDPQKTGNMVCGLPVYAEGDEIINRINTMNVQEVVIAIPDAEQEEKNKLYMFYKETGCKVKIYDYPFSAKDSENAKRSLREFQIEDLLFRDTIRVSGKKTEAFYTDRTVLVTGGGGSIGSELCRQIAKLRPKKLVIVDIYENNAYDIQQELIRKHGDKLHLEVYIASVRDVKRMEQIFREVRPELVFHAAAHKHVPLMQVSGCEAIKNNVMGTYNVANLAEKYGVQKFLLISTDKAVNPTNIMGASKRLCEMVIQCRQDSKTEFTAVRFGNVLGSNGSVIPLFRRQIEAGGSVTLTDKRIIRYFMTIPEAVGLVMETCCMAHNGELFVLDMGKPVKILDLAENMIRMSGLTPYVDIDITEIGLRPGEKLYEELLMKTEELDKTDNDLIFIERDKCLSREAVEAKLRIINEAVEKERDILEAVRATVPTYRDPDELNKKAAESEEMRNVKQLEAVS